MIKSVDYHIIDKCNLNCARCNDFCPLVPATDNGKSIEQIKADLILLSKVKDEFAILNLMGGEPTLHPQLSKVLETARKIFPTHEITMITNGTKYNHFERWKDAIIKNHIKVIISAYPYCDDYEDRIETIKTTLGPDVETEVWGCAVDLGFNSDFLSNYTGNVTEDDIFDCYRRYNCSQVKNGKLYLCSFAAHFDRLKDYFEDKIKFEMDGKEYLDLNGDITARDFYDFIFGAHPMLCDHCLGAHYNWVCPKKPWEVSKKDITEWIID